MPLHVINLPGCSLFSDGKTVSKRWRQIAACMLSALTCLQGAAAASALAGTHTAATLTQATERSLAPLQSSAPANLTLQEVRLSGNLPRSRDALQQIENLIGQEISAPLLDEVLKQVSHYYQDAGYRQSLALLPEQVIDKDGILNVYLASPTLGSTTLLQSPGSYLRPGTAAMLLAPFQESTGQPVNQDALQSQILKLSDLGIFNLQGSFEKSADPLIQDLNLKLSPTKRLGFGIFSDNHGTKASGRYRTGALLNWLNPTGSADLLSLFYARSSHRQHNYSLNYQIPVSSHPTVLGASICLSDYELGHEFADLGAEGKSWEFSFYAREPLYRSLRQRTDLNLGYRYRDLTDEFTEFDLKFEQHSNALWLAVDEAYRGDVFSFGGRAQYTVGKLENDDDFELYDEGVYQLLNLSALFSVKAADSLSFNTLLETQFTADDVDGSEEFTAGGADAVSGFDSSTLSGDSGALIKIYPEIKPFAAFDLAVRPNFKAAVVKDKDCERDTLSSVGLELAASFKGFYGKLSLDLATGDKPYTDLDDGKVWFELGYRC